MNVNFENSDLPEIVKPEDMPFMHYGIINSNNFSEEKIESVPIKRWDPIAFNYSLNEKYDLYSYISGHYSYISPIRAERPVERKKNMDETQDNCEKTEELDKEQEEKDIFQPMMDGKHWITKDKILPAHTIIISEDNKERDHPFTDSAKVYTDITGNAVTMINKFPAMVRIIDENVLGKISNKIREMDKNAKIAKGICTVTIPKKYHTKIRDIPDNDLTSMFISMQSAITYCLRILKGEGYVSVPISPFFNIGKMVGGSLNRIHSQIYMDLSQDGHGSRMEYFLTSFAKMERNGDCHLCSSTHSHSQSSRIVIENEDWAIFATGSPIRNYHLRFSPKEHIIHFGQISKSQFLSLSSLLKVVFKALDLLDVNSNRNIILNTKPFGYHTSFHFFGDILPHEFVGGAEMADDMRVVRTSPIRIAQDLRAKIKYMNLNS